MEKFLWAAAGVDAAASDFHVGYLLASLFIGLVAMGYSLASITYRRMQCKLLQDWQGDLERHLDTIETYILRLSRQDEVIAQLSSELEDLSDRLDR